MDRMELAADDSPSDSVAADADPEQLTQPDHTVLIGRDRRDQAIDGNCRWMSAHFLPRLTLCVDRPRNALLVRFGALGIPHPDERSRPAPRAWRAD
jgi:hypothetical protein